MPEPTAVDQRGAVTPKPRSKRAAVTPKPRSKRAAVAASREEERKYDVEPGFVVPELTDCLPAGVRVTEHQPVYLRAVYYDTADLRLARAGASLRFRRGDRLPWTVKLPTDVPGTRTEVSRAGAPGTVPGELVALVTAYSRGRGLEPVAVLRTSRRVYEVRGADGELLAELDDDTVAVLEGKSTRMKFREIEVERHRAGRALLNRIDTRLRAAGAVTGGFTPKLVRALGALQPPDLVPPGDRLPRRATIGDVVTRTLRADISRIFAHDPLVRLREPLPGGDTAVHQMRVGCRRLRSDLRTFRPVLNAAWADGLRGQLRWLAEILGAARDAEVLRARLRKTAALDPLAPLDDAAVARIDAELAARYEEALTALSAAVRGDRYLHLLDDLVAAAGNPQLVAARAHRPALDLLPRLVSRPWQRLAYGADGVTGAGDLDPLAPDATWHRVRVRAKRARYAAEAVAGAFGTGAFGGKAAELGTALAAVQNLLGDHQDAVVAEQTWLAIAREDPDDHALAVTAGRLVERERAAVRRAREAFPGVWRAADRPRLVDWLP